LYYCYFQECTRRDCWLS